MKERRGNVIENKGPVFCGPGQSGNVIENTGSYALKPGMLLERKVFSFFLSLMMGLWPEVFRDDFRNVKYLEVIALGVVGGVLKHDGTVGAGHHHRGGLGCGELGESKFVHSLAVLIALIVSYKKLRAAGSAALRVLAMVRNFGQRDSAGAKDFPRRSGDAAAPRKVARVMVSCRHGGWLYGELREQFRNEFGMVHYPDIEFCVRRDLPVVFIQHRRTVRAARCDFLHPGICQCLDKLFGELQEKVFVPRASRRFTAAGFTGKHAP